MKNALLHLLRLLLPCSCLALLGQTLPFRTYSIEDGLAHSTVQSIHQDQTGYLWFGTNGGLSRFDGLSFVNYERGQSFPLQLVRDIAESPDGVLYFGGVGGLVRRDRDAFSLILLDPNQPHLEVRELTFGPNGTLIAATADGLFRWEDEVAEHFSADHGLPDNAVRALAPASDGSIWVGTRRGLAMLGREGVTPFLSESAIAGADIRALLEDHLGNLWIGTDRKGLFLWNGSELSAFEPMAGESIPYIFQDVNQEIWIATRDSGAMRFREGAFTAYDREKGLTTNGVMAMTRDREGSLWFGTFGGGAVQLPNENFLNYLEQDGFTRPNVYSISQDASGRMWFGTNGGGVSILESDGNFRALSKKDGLSEDKVYAIYPANDRDMWLATLRGISIFEEDNFKVLGPENGLPDQVFYDVCEYPTGTFWFATYRGLVRYRAGEVRVFLQEDGLPSSRVNCLLPSRDGSLWMGTARGLVRYSNDTFETIDLAASGADLFVNDMAEAADGTLWIATTFGLAAYRDGAFRHLTRDDGLADNAVKAVVTDSDGNLWIGTNRGVNMFGGESVITFTGRDGMPSSEVNRGAGFRDRSGNVWIGTIHGVTRFSAEDNLASDAAPPAVVITQLEVLNQSVSLDEIPRLTASENSLEIEYAGISFLAPESLVYRCKLEGFDETWRERRVRSIQFTALPPGDYSFLVYARSATGLESDQPARIDFTIIPPYWRQTWFMVLAGVLLFLLGRYLYLNQARRAAIRAEIAAAKAANETKNQFLAHTSHELRTPLNAIIGYSELLEEDFRDDDNARYIPDIKRILLAANQLLRLINNILDLSKIESGHMSVHLEDVRLNDLLNTVKSTVAPLIEKNRNRFEMVNQVAAETVMIDRAKVSQILLNLLSNAGKFTEDGDIALRVSEMSDGNGDWICFEVADSGIGMTREQISRLFREYVQVHSGISSRYGGTGLGLVLCKRFCHMMKGRLNVESEQGSGTTFSIQLPARPAETHA